METQLISSEYFTQQPRWDFRFYDPKYLEVENLLDKGKYPAEPLASHVKQIVNFGAYSLCNLLVWVDDGIPYLRVTDLKEWGIDWSNVPHIPPKVHAQLPKSKVYPHDVLYSMAGTIGIAVVAPEDSGECNSNQAIAQIRLKEGLDPYYLAVFLNTRLGRHQSERIANGQTVLNINMSEIGKIRVPIPPHSVQGSIATIMQEAYATRRAMLAEAEKLLGGIDDYVLGELGIDWGEISDIRRLVIESTDLLGGRFDVEHQSPQAKQALQLLRESGHTIVQLRDIIEVIHYGASIKNEYFPEGIPFIRISNLTPNELDTSDIVFLSEAVREQLGKAFVEAGDLLMSRSGSVGIVACVPLAAEGFAFGSYQIKFRLRAGTADPKYIACVLNSPLGRAQTQQQKTGAVQMNITIPGIKAIRVPIPDVDVQKRIVQTADEMRHKARELQRDAETVIAETKARVERMILGEAESNR